MRTVGTCINRWFDKTLQLVVCRNGSAGILFEHSMVDGHTVLRLASDVFTDTILCVSVAVSAWQCCTVSNGRCVLAAALPRASTASFPRSWKHWARPRRPPVWA